MDQLHSFERTLNGLVWGWPMIVLLLGTGLLLTILTGLVQFRRLPAALREVLGKMFTKGHGAGSVTPFQAVATALASTVGVGNIAGDRDRHLHRRSGGACCGSGCRACWGCAPNTPRS